MIEKQPQQARQRAATKKVDRQQRSSALQHPWPPSTGKAARRKKCYQLLRYRQRAATNIDGDYTRGSALRELAMPSADEAARSINRGRQPARLQPAAEKCVSDLA